MNDFAASIYNLLFGLGNLAYPILGSALVEWLEFRAAFDVISMVLLINSLVYLIFTFKDWKTEINSRKSFLKLENDQIEE